MNFEDPSSNCKGPKMKATTATQINICFTDSNSFPYYHYEWFSQIHLIPNQTQCCYEGASLSAANFSEIIFAFLPSSHLKLKIKWSFNFGNCFHQRFSLTLWLNLRSKKSAHAFLSYVIRTESHIIESWILHKYNDQIWKKKKKAIIVEWWQRRNSLESEVSNTRSNTPP